MSPVVGKPKKGAGLPWNNVSFGALTMYFYLSYSSDNADSAWSGMEAWFEKASEHFTQLVSRQNTAALVVFWHWSSLVDRAGGHYWFLKSSGAKTRRNIMEYLPQTEGIRELTGM